MEYLPPQSSLGLSPVAEALKRESCFLRGQIADELRNESDHFSEPSAFLLRHHGIHQQVDRDLHGPFGDSRLRTQTRYEFLVRIGIPGGRMSGEQFLALLDLCDTFSDGRLKLTSRQNLELHGLAKRDLPAVMRRIIEIGLSTVGTCGDLNRNVVCCPAPYRNDPVHDQMHAMSRTLAVELAPKFKAYREIWLNEAPLESSLEEEPLYGSTYLPNKFKIAIGLPGDNCVDIHAQDIGLLAICENFRVVGYNVLVGGGMDCDDDKAGVSMAVPLAFIGEHEVVDTVKAIVQLYRDHGSRVERSRTRLKYLYAQWGLPRFRSEIESILGRELLEPRDEKVWDIDDHLGWHEQGDGRWFYGLLVPNGRLEDTHRTRWKSAVRGICAKYRWPIYLTSGQNLLFGDIRWEDRLDFEDHLRRHDVRSEREVSKVGRWASACTSLPTCPKAVGESERALPALLEQLEVELVRLGLQDEVFSLRMSGCPHSCTRPHSADVGLVGRGAGRYSIILGGRRLGDRIGFMYRDGIPLEAIVAELSAVLDCFKLHRLPDESFGDFCFRIGSGGLNIDS